ncbi:hypothetical protein [Paludisphaera sp.]|uniref:hypothetical protein n=1 Tax=Paludisphaera sp. TaxID=2017432 RepID=UPI00301C4067
MPLALIARLLEQSGPGLPEELLDGIRANSEEILSLLVEDEEIAERLDSHLDAFDPDTLAMLYDALAGDVPGTVPAEAGSLAAAMQDASRDEDVCIGWAWANALMVDLPDNLGNLDRCLEGAPIAPDGVVKLLMEQVDSKAAGRDAAHWVRALARRGLSPVSIFQAADAVSGLIERLARRGKLREGQGLLLDASGGLSGPEDFGRDMVIESIGHATDCEPSTARRLIAWLVGVAQARPRLFRGLEAEPRGPLAVRLSLQPRAMTTDHDADLILRWSPSREAAPIQKDAEREGRCGQHAYM